MVRPEIVDYTGIHTMWKGVRYNLEVCELSDADALVHHYRWWDDPSRTWVVDKFMHQYGPLLLNQVQHVHGQVYDNRSTLS